MRERLLAAAAECFANYGFERTRVADIVALAHTSHGNFYRHFADKSAILLAVLEGLYREISARTSREPGAGRVPTEADLIRRNIAFFHLYADHRHLLRVAREAAAAGDAGGFLDFWLQIRGIFAERNTAWLTRLRADGLIDAGIDPALTAEALGSMGEQLAYVQVGLARVRPRPEQLDDLGRVCGRIWYRTLFAKAPD
ncbi:TetR/AcrR family transcriptional regulator [Sandaracinobacteroides saxicola]|uniref:TetR/AcrR family transcriptional regulator n=1 Tax=Sandaracinobacteroides saxicola TaxID=2759707 RepID=A0A7G5IJI1_9SPHN|nr:TetR/AcrR family transcriptional regulator [Sandaracinobacteroides saxicola]QMW23523.1 TetR/AcrR family transcriptional regulator [Sandaracinobacteroides saxicola]